MAYVFILYKLCKKKDALKWLGLHLSGDPFISAGKWNVNLF